MARMYAPQKAREFPEWPDELTVTVSREVADMGMRRECRLCPLAIALVKEHRPEVTAWWHADFDAAYVIDFTAKKRMSPVYGYSAELYEAISRHDKKQDDPGDGKSFPGTFTLRRVDTPPERAACAQNTAATGGGEG